MISYLDEESDADDAVRDIEQAGRQALKMPSDIGASAHCRKIVAAVPDHAGQHRRDRRRGMGGTVPHQRPLAILSLQSGVQPGSSVINTSSVNAKHPTPGLLAYSATKAAIANFTIGLAQMLVEKGIRVNAVLPGPIGTPFIPTGMKPEQVKNFGNQSPMGRPGQPAELAAAYVYLASDDASFTTGSLLPVHGGMAIY